MIKNEIDSGGCELHSHHLDGDPPQRNDDGDGIYDDLDGPHRLVWRSDAGRER